MEPYFVAKSLHIISFVAWFAALFYLPRLFVYHSTVKVGSDTDKIFQVMEHKLYKLIMTPAMIATIIFGLWLTHINGLANLSGWFHAKMLLIVVLIGYHHMLLSYLKKFKKGQNQKSENFFRIINEVPTVVLIGAVFLAVLKPF